MIINTGSVPGHVQSPRGVFLHGARGRDSGGARKGLGTVRGSDFANSFALK